jgi:hypothetical protein
MVWIVVRNILGAVESASPSPSYWECFGTIDCLPNLKINRADLSSITCSNRSLRHYARRSVNERDCLQTDRSSRELIAAKAISLSLSSSYSAQYRIYIGACCPNEISPHVLKCSTQNLDRYAGASNKICTRLHRCTLARTRLASTRSAVCVSALLTKKFAVYRYAYRRTHAALDDDEVQVDLRARKSRTALHNQ